MAKKELVSFVKPEETPPFGGTIHFKNPRYFYDHESIPAYCTHFVTNDERVRKAYLAAGKIDYGQEKTDAVQQKERKEEKEEQVVSPKEDNSEKSPKADKAVEDMTWHELRSYAATLTDEPIKNKQDALRVIAENG